MSAQLKIYDPSKLGKLSLKNHFVMAPMTRSRSTQPGDIPNQMMAEYYAQRAPYAGLIITEATQISSQGKGYSYTPGIYTKEQIEGWKLVTQAVHKNGGKIFLQLWHVGRMSHESLHADGITVGPSAINPNAKVWIVGKDGIGRMVDCPTPRALETHEIKSIINDFRVGARNAIEAGFDGVEIHGGNGYLIDEFLRRTANTRTDEYGGPIENRIRFAVEVAQAVADEVGADRTGIRLAPFIKQRGMDDDESVAAILKLAEELDKIKIVYIHLAEADWDDAPQVDMKFRFDLRKVYKGKIIVAGNYSVEKGNTLINENLVDLVAFGRPFIANPDFPERSRYNWKMSEFDSNALFGGSANGYTTYKIYEGK